MFLTVEAAARSALPELTSGRLKDYYTYQNRVDAKLLSAAVLVPHSDRRRVYTNIYKQIRLT